MEKTTANVNLTASSKKEATPIASNGEEKDPLEEMLDRTGCKEVHFSLQECMYEHRDWRKCQNLVSSLRQCMLEYEQRRNGPTPN
ncbi:Cytochrome oxidase assembly factor 4 [Tyrophagus putrescentiae]|nr:Cytochrome oxidase assembly factor 4 [Tyrophagus putrescentiae]